MAGPIRVAIVSDVHGNMMALEAVLAEMEKLGPFDHVVGGGDYVAGGAFSNAVLSHHRNSGWSLVRGNSDEEVVAAGTDDRIPVSNRPEGAGPNEMVVDVMRWNAGLLSEDDLDFLANLDLTWSVDGPSGQRLVFAHSTPTSSHPVFGPNDPDEVFMPFFAATGAAVYLYGHIHHAWMRETPAGTVGCVGSVGLPLDGDHRSCFLIATDDGSGWTLEHHRVAYDHEAYAQTLLNSGMPHAEVFAARVRKAGN